MGVVVRPVSAPTPSASRANAELNSGVMKPGAERGMCCMKKNAALKRQATTKPMWRLTGRRRDTPSGTG